jgi:hypothetical protein
MEKGFQRLAILASNNNNTTEGKRSTVPSMSSFGSSEIIRYQKLSFSNITNTENVIIQSFDPFFAEIYSDEEAMNDKLFKTLLSLTEINDLEDGIIVINSERTLWLYDPDDHEGKRKPDFLRVHKAFFKSAKDPHGSDRSLNYGGVKNSFVDQVLFIYEGKVKSISTGHTNIGIGLNYVNLLSNSGVLKPRGLLFNKEEIIAIDNVDTRLLYGEWTTTPKEELKRFILDVGYPKLTSALILACRRLNVKCTLGGYIAKGASAYAFEVEDTNNEKMVLKLFLRSTVNDDPTFEARIDDEFSRGTTAKNEVPNLVVPLSYYVIHADYGAILYEYRGLFVTYPLQKCRRLLGLLKDLHMSGFAHCDARIQNIIEYEGTLKFIDFATFAKLSERMNARQLIMNDLDKLIRSCKWTNNFSDQISEYADIICDATSSKEDREKRYTDWIEKIESTITTK